MKRPAITDLGVHYVETHKLADLDRWEQAFCADGIEQIEALLAKHLAFARYCDERDAQMH